MDNPITRVWYDLFSTFYDAALERPYLAHRQQALDALAPGPGMTVVDVGCGTGASFPLLAAAVGPQGRVIGIDASPGMLGRARRRVQRNRWQNVELWECDAQTRQLPQEIAQRAGRIDRVLCFLSSSVITDFEQTFERWFDVLVPSGRFVIADVHHPAPNMFGRLVELVSRGRLQRRSWQLLERNATSFNLEWQKSSWRLGGQFYVASGMTRASSKAGSCSPAA